MTIPDRSTNPIGREVASRYIRGDIRIGSRRPGRSPVVPSHLARIRRTSSRHSDPPRGPHRHRRPRADRGRGALRQLPEGGPSRPAVGGHGPADRRGPARSRRYRRPPAEAGPPPGLPRGGRLGRGDRRGPGAGPDQRPRHPGRQQVVVVLGDGRERPVKQVWRDPKSDLALLDDRPRRAGPGGLGRLRGDRDRRLGPRRRPAVRALGHGHGGDRQRQGAGDRDGPL